MSPSSTQSSFLRHQACPRCRENGRDREGNNLGVYDDGHEHCFSCGFYVPSDTIRRLEKLVETEANTKVSREEPHKGIYLPKDAGGTIDSKALEWLHKYDIRWDEMRAADVRWAAMREWLIFPYKGSDNEILAFQARCFSPNEPKWKTMGNVEDLTHLLGDQGDGIIVVEDIVSAIKVSRHATVMPLFGSHLGMKRLARLRHLTKDITIWLDPDKYKNSMEFSRKAQVLGLKARAVYTEKDPKECTDEEIIATIS